MGLIKKPSELALDIYPAVLIYGQPGIGKSTLALSAPDPLYFDFDRGVHRVNSRHQKDTVQISNWQNMLDVLNNEDLREYKTFIIDTAGKMLDYMGLWLIERNPKLGKANGALALQGYGERKAEFSNFLKRVQLMGKNLVFVAHDKEDKDGDQKTVRPEIGGSSGSDLIKELDLVGYMEAIGQKRTISFDPCEKFYGKNTCGLPARVEIVDVVNGGNANNFLSNVFTDFKANLQKRKEMGENYLQLIDVADGKIESVETADDLNEIVQWASKFEEHIWDSKLQIRNKIVTKAKSMGFGINAERKYFKPEAQPVAEVKAENEAPKIAQEAIAEEVKETPAQNQAEPVKKTKKVTQNKEVADEQPTLL